MAGLVALTVDAAFCVLTVVRQQTDAVRGFTVGREGGYAEWVQYAQLFVFSALLAWLATRLRCLVYAAWAVIYAYLMVDDANEFHEHGGVWIKDLLRLDRRFNVDPVHIGEALYLGLVVTVAAVLVMLAWRFDRSGIDTRWMVGLSAVYAVAGGFFDFIHARSPGSVVLSLLEDGGEMVVVSVGIALAVARLNPQTISTRELRLLNDTA